MSTARRAKFDEELYTPVQSNLRLARIRRILAARGCDALLLIGGVDSLNSKSCAKGLNYLLLGHSGHLLKSDVLGDDTLEDVMVFIHPGGVRLYSTPPCATKLNAITAAWANCEVLLLDERSFKDQDVFEDHKVACFKDMVEGFKTIGIPASGDVRKTIEKWPMIQSYAVDDKGGSRMFFTMAHQVVDVTADLDAVYGAVDAHGLTTMLLTSLPTFKRHWDTALSNLDSVYGGSKSALVPKMPAKGIQDFVSEPLYSYYEYGTLRSRETMERYGIAAPQVWFGGQTKDGSGAADQPVHMTVTMQDPQSPIWCARTYFLATGYIPELDALTTYTGPADDTETAQYVATVAGDVKCLMAHYLMLSLALQLMQADIMDGKLSISAGVPSAAPYVTTAAGQLGLAVPKTLDTSLQVTARQMDFSAFHRTDAAPPTCDPCCVLQLGLKLDNVMSPDDSTRSLGSVIFGDSFASGGGQQLCSITGNIAPFEAWCTLRPERAMGKFAVSALQAARTAHESDTTSIQTEESLGRFITDWTDDSGMSFATPASGIASRQSCGDTATAFEHGLVLMHKRVGPYSVLQWKGESSVERVTVYDTMELNSPIVVVLQLKADCTATMSKGVKGAAEDNCVVMCFNIHSRGKRTLLSEVMPKWKASWDSNGVEYEVLEQPATDLLGRCHSISENVLKMATKIQLMEMEEEEGHTMTPEALAFHQVVEDHPGLGPCCTKLQEDVALMAADGQSWDPSPLQPDNDCLNDRVVSLHILNGLPGSGKHKLARTIVHYITTKHAGANVQTVSFSMQEGVVYKANLMKQKLLTALGVAPKTGKVHLLVVSPGYTAVATLIHSLQAITAELNKDLAGTGRTIKIESSNTLVNTDNFYCNHVSKPAIHIIPHLLDQCTQGFVSSILVQSITSGITTSQVESHLRLCNNHCDVVYSPLALISAMGLGTGDAQDDDAATAECNLHSPEMQRARVLAIPGPYLKTADIVPLKSIYLNIMGLPTCEFSIMEFLNKIVDPKQSSILVVLAKLHVEGYARDLTIFNGKMYRSTLSKPTTDSVIRRDQCFFMIGRDLDEALVTSRLREVLHSESSVMKTILNIDGRGEFENSKAKRPLLTRESLVPEDIDYIASLNRETPLPEGCYYDGSQYIDPNGRRSNKRPDLDDLCDRFIEEQNALITADNQGKA